MNKLMEIVSNIWDMAVAAGPWLLIGFVAAALVKALVPTHIVARWLGGGGGGAVLRASVVGIPLPLCSCGVLPTALGLRRQGASKPATVSFLVSTPEIGLDSFMLSYALLGPVMAVSRPIAALGSALVAGFAAIFAQRREAIDDVVDSAKPQAACCGGENDEPKRSPIARVIDGLRYVFTKLLDDISKWLIVAIVVAGLMTTFIGPDTLAKLGSGLPAMLVMLVVGVPLYLCATASTPIAAALLMTGVSPGTVLVLLLAGPATNIGSIGVLRKELGVRVLVAYLLAIAVCSVGAGLALDAAIARYTLNVTPTVRHEHGFFPYWFALAATALLIVLAIRPLRRLPGRLLVGGNKAAATGSTCCTTPAEPADVQTPGCCGADKAEPDRAASFRV